MLKFSKNRALLPFYGKRTEVPGFKDPARSCEPDSNNIYLIEMKRSHHEHNSEQFNSENFGMVSVQKLSLDCLMENI